VNDAGAWEPLRTITPSIGHVGVVTSVGFSPDGRHVLTTSRDGTACLWRTHTGYEVRRFRGDPSGVRHAAFSPGGGYLVAHGTTCARIWRVDTGEEAAQLMKHGAEFRALAVSADDRHVLTSCEDDSVRLLDADDGRELHMLQLWGATAVALSPCGRWVLAGGDDLAGDGLWADEWGGIALWEVDSGRFVRRLTPTWPEDCLLAFSPDGKYILGSQLGGQAWVWERETGREVGRFDGLEHGPAVFAPDGRSVAAGAGSGVALWDVQSGDALHRFTCFFGTRIDAAAFSPEGDRLLTGTVAGVVDIWDVKTGKHVLTCEGRKEWGGCTGGVSLPGGATSVAFSPDGRLVLAGCSDAAQLWTADDGAAICEYTTQADAVVKACFTSDAQSMVTAGGSTVHVWDLRTGQEARRLTGHLPSIRSLAVAPDGGQVLANSLRYARLSDAGIGKIEGRYGEHATPVTAVAFSADGRFVATGSEGGDVHLWGRHGSPTSTTLVRRRQLEVCNRAGGSRGAAAPLGRRGRRPRSRPPRGARD
jgi:WD40 repeat protein